MGTAVTLPTLAMVCMVAAMAAAADPAPPAMLPPLTLRTYHYGAGAGWSPTAEVEHAPETGDPTPCMTGREFAAALAGDRCAIGAEFDAIEQRLHDRLAMLEACAVMFLEEDLMLVEARAGLIADGYGADVCPSMIRVATPIWAAS